MSGDRPPVRFIAVLKDDGTAPAYGPYEPAEAAAVLQDARAAYMDQGQKSPYMWIIAATVDTCPGWTGLLL